MKRICLLFLLCISLMVCPVMAEENSETAAMVEQARVLMDEGNYEAAVPILQEAADLGDAEGQTQLASAIAMEKAWNRIIQRP